MLPDYLSEIKPLEDKGYTDEQISAELGARHTKDVPATTGVAGVVDILHILSSRAKVLRLNNAAEWQGALVTYFSDPNVNAQLKTGFEELLTNLQIGNRMVYCGSDGATGTLVTTITQIVGGLLDAGQGNPLQTSVTIQAEMDALTGGVKYPSLLPGNIGEARTAYVESQAEGARRQAALAAYQTTVRGKINAADAAAKAAYQSADYSQAIDHAAAVIAAANTAYNA